MASLIAELSAVISSNTQKLDEYMTSKSLSKPSFFEEGSVTHEFSAEVEASRIAAIDAAVKLQALLQGPTQQLQPYLNMSILQAIYHFDIASKVPVGGEITMDELAAACGLHETDLRRIVRYAIVHYFIFREPRKGVIAHSAASRRLVEEQRQRDRMGLMSEDISESFSRTVEALEKYKGQDPRKTGWSLAHNDMALFQTLEHIPAKAKRFANAMSTFSDRPTTSYGHVVREIDWDSIAVVAGDNAVVVDLGGAHGELCAAIAAEHQSLRFVVQELPRTVQSVDRNKLPATVKERIEFIEHDFFTPQTVVAPVYLFRQILHNWPDAYALRILRQLIPCLCSGARIIVQDIVLPEPGTVPLVQERDIRAIDMIMLSAANSRERDEMDWRNLFAEADPRFKVSRIFTPKGAQHGLIDVVWIEEGTETERAK